MSMEFDPLHPLQTMVGLTVKRVWHDPVCESLLVDFESAGLVCYCAYSFEPPQPILEDLVGQSVKELKESELKYTITFENGSKLQLEPLPDKFVFAPEAFIYHNDNFDPPLEVVVDKIE
ncbi:MAG: hypothetical protein AB7W16_24825 [Candidatus Obscuribacterales bacterium]